MRETNDVAIFFNALLKLLNFSLSSYFFFLLRNMENNDQPMSDADQVMRCNKEKRALLYNACFALDPS